VVQQGCIDGFRATQMIQDKAQSAVNDVSITRAATPDWIIWVAPFGRVVKRSSAVLRLLARTRRADIASVLHHLATVRTLHLRDAPGGCLCPRVQPLHNSLNPSILICWTTSSGLTDYLRENDNTPVASAVPIRIIAPPNTMLADRLSLINIAPQTTAKPGTR